MVEHFNRTLISQLAKALLATGGEWDDYFKSVAFAYNTSVHATTKFTPYYLVHGREARVPVDVLVPSQQGRWGVFPSPEDYVTSLAEKLETAFGAARRASTCARETQKLCHDAAARHRRRGSWSGSLNQRRTGRNLHPTGRARSGSWKCWVRRGTPVSPIGLHFLWNQGDKSRLFTTIG